MNNSDWLRLTIEDIAAQNSGSEGSRLSPTVLILRPEEIPEQPARPIPAAHHAVQVTAGDVAAFEPAGAEVVAELERLMFELVNEARHAHIPAWLHRGPLRWHPGLAAAARQHATDMLTRNYVSHQSPDGLHVGGRLNRANISYLACGENIGVIYGPASHGRQGLQEIHDAFMDQPRRLTNHRGNLLNPLWTHAGIGVAYAPEGRLIVTQNFITTLTNPV